MSFFQNIQIKVVDNIKKSKKSVNFEKQLRRSIEYKDEQRNTIRRVVSPRV